MTTTAEKTERNRTKMKPFFTFLDCDILTAVICQHLPLLAKALSMMFYCSNISMSTQFGTDTALFQILTSSGGPKRPWDLQPSLSARPPGTSWQFVGVLKLEDLSPSVSQPVGASQVTH